MSNNSQESVHIPDVAECDPTNAKLLHVANGHIPISTEERRTNSCLSAGAIRSPALRAGGPGRIKRSARSGTRLVTDFVVLLTDGWSPRFSGDLAMLKAAGAEITDVCAETGIVEGVIAGADLDALSRLPCVDRVTQGLTYLCEKKVSCKRRLTQQLLTPWN